MTYTLLRIKQSDEGTFGQFRDQYGTLLCVTCEPPPTAEHPDIPAGIYQVIPHNSPAHPNTWEISNVPNRTNVLIHNGNDENDSLGCVLVGDKLGTVDNLPAVLDSKPTLDMLRGILPPNFTLEIIENFS